MKKTKLLTADECQKFPRYTLSSWQIFKYYERVFRKKYIPDPLPIALIKLKNEYGLRWYGRGYRMRILFGSGPK